MRAGRVAAALAGLLAAGVAWAAGPEVSRRAETAALERAVSGFAGFSPLAAVAKNGGPGAGGFAGRGGHVGGAPRGGGFGASHAARLDRMVERDTSVDDNYVSRNYIGAPPFGRPPPVRSRAAPQTYHQCPAGPSPYPCQTF